MDAASVTTRPAPWRWSIGKAKIAKIESLIAMLSRARVAASIERLRSSYWFVPAAMAILSLLLAFAAREADAWMIRTDFWLLRYLPAATAEGARSVLSLIASAMITVAGVVFSITIVAVSFASGQFGPRLIGNMMRDRGSQVTLGVFVSTFVYTMGVIQSLNSGGFIGDGTIPPLSLFIGYVMAGCSVSVLIYFIHHVQESININTLVSSVGKSLAIQVNTLFPEQAEQSEGVEPDGWDKHRFLQNYRSSKTGYIQAIDLSALASLGCKHDTYMTLMRGPGEFVVEGDVLLTFRPMEGHVDQSELNDSFESSFAMGIERTAYQNVFFLADELVEILARALSPGINDPFTAISSMNWMRAAMQAMANRQPPSQWVADDTGTTRLKADTLSFAEFIDHVCDQIVPYVAADRNTALHMMKMLRDLSLNVERADRRAHLVSKAEALMKAADEVLPLQADRNALASNLAEFRSA